MSVRIIVGSEQGTIPEVAVLFDSVTGTAFGPVFAEDGEGSAAAHAQAFLDWLGEADGLGGGPVDARSLAPNELMERYATWLGTVRDGE